MTRAETVAAADATRTRIRLPASFDVDWMRRFLLLRRVPALETWTDETYVRSVWVDAADDDVGNAARAAGHRARVDARDAGRSVALIIHHSQRLSRRNEASTVAHASLDVTCAPALPAATVRALITRMFDLDADLDAFAAHVRRDRLLGPLVRRRPYVRLPRVIDPFEGLVRAMLGQQVTVRAASTMTDRFVRRFGTPHQAAAPPVADGLFSFPRPEAIVRVGDDGLRAIGLTRAKSSAIARLAEAIACGRLDCARLARLNADEAHEALVALPGIGPWTASYVRMRVLGDRDAFPAADLGVIKALEALGVPRAQQAAVAERWRPWRGYATVHLWESLSAD